MSWQLQRFFFLSLYTHESLKYTNTIFLLASTSSSSCCSVVQLESIGNWTRFFFLSIYTRESLKNTNTFFLPASTSSSSCNAVQLHSIELTITKIFFSLSIYTWIIKIQKYIYFTSQHKQQQCRTATFSWVNSCKDFFFSLSIHTWHMSPSTSPSLFSSLSPLFSLSLPVVTKPLFWLSLSTTLRIALAVSLSTYYSLFFSSYTHLSLSLSKKISFSHYKFTIVNKYYIFFFIFSWLQIWRFETWNLLQNLD